jgi:hypothetical protein
LSWVNFLCICIHCIPLDLLPWLAWSMANYQTEMFNLLLAAGACVCFCVDNFLDWKQEPGSQLRATWAHTQFSSLPSNRPMPLYKILINTPVHDINSKELSHYKKLNCKTRTDITSQRWQDFNNKSNP